MTEPQILTIKFSMLRRDNTSQKMYYIILKSKTLNILLYIGKKKKTNRF